MKSVKILLIGAQGQLGQEFQHALGDGKTYLGPIPQLFNNCDITCADIEQLDVTDETQVNTEISKGYDFVINCSAYTAVDKAESDCDNCNKVNALAPLYLAAACKKFNATLVHFSTDYVYGGNKTVPYRENDECLPNTVYGKTKLQGERNLIQNCDKYFIFRTAWLYGKYGNNFVYKMLQLAENHPQINVVNDQYGTPTYASDLVHVALNVMATTHYGTYNCSGEGQCTWYQFALEIFRLMHVDVTVKPVSSEQFPSAAKRPKYSVMENNALNRLNMNYMSDWKCALSQFINTIKGNK